MKQSFKTMASFAFTLAIAGNALLAQTNIITVDENGHATFNGVNLPFAIGPDPSGGVAGNVLSYALPFPVVPGDIGLIEPNSPFGNTNSDIVRFFNQSGANQSLLIFYSDRADTTDLDLADSGLPNSPNAILLNEIGPEGNNGAVWTPGPGLPGFDTSGVLTTYNIISDVPEPGTCSMLCSGLGLLLWFGHLRRKATS
jgi:hypothetical protein